MSNTFFYPRVNPQIHDKSPASVSQENHLMTLENSQKIDSLLNAVKTKVRKITIGSQFYYEI
jgi:hypothetical protein